MSKQANDMSLINLNMQQGQPGTKLWYVNYIYHNLIYMYILYMSTVDTTDTPVVPLQISLP